MLGRYWCTSTSDTCLSLIKDTYAALQARYMIHVVRRVSMLKRTSLPPVYTTHYSIEAQAQVTTEYVGFVTIEISHQSSTLAAYLLYTTTAVPIAHTKWAPNIYSRHTGRHTDLSPKPHSADTQQVELMIPPQHASQLIYQGSLQAAETSRGLLCWARTADSFPTSCMNNRGQTVQRHPSHDQ